MFASYPFGDQNLLLRRAMAACGYAGAVTTSPGLSRLGDNLMALPRQIVLRDDDLDAFVAKLGAPERATLDRRLRFRYDRLVQKQSPLSRVDPLRRVTVLRVALLGCRR